MHNKSFLGRIGDSVWFPGELNGNETKKLDLRK